MIKKRMKKMKKQMKKKNNNCIIIKLEEVVLIILININSKLFIKLTFISHLKVFLIILKIIHL